MRSRGQVLYRKPRIRNPNIYHPHRGVLGVLQIVEAEGFEIGIGEKLRIYFMI